MFRWQEVEITIRKNHKRHDFTSHPARQLCPISMICIYIFLHLNEWMNEWCIYIALYCVLLYTQSTLQSRGQGGLLNHHQCAASTWSARLPWQRRQLAAHHRTSLQVERRESHRANQVVSLTTHQLQVERRESHRPNQSYALTTHLYRWRGERVIEPIKCMRSPHTSYRWRGESHRANQVYALTTPSYLVERERES